MSTRWQHWAMLVLGAWLVLSPFWMPGYTSVSSVAAWNSYVFGILVAAFAIAALGGPQRWEESIELAMGLWLVMAPFVLTFFNSENVAAWNQIVAGLLIALDAAWMLATLSRGRVGA